MQHEIEMPENVLTESPYGKLYTDQFWPKWTGGIFKPNILMLTKDLKLKLVEKPRTGDISYRVIETFDISDIELENFGDLSSRMFRFKIRGEKHVFQLLDGPGWFSFGPRLFGNLGRVIGSFMAMQYMVAQYEDGIRFFAHIQLAKTTPSAFRSYGSEHFYDLLQDSVGKYEFNAVSKSHFKMATATIFYLIPVILVGIIYLRLSNSPDNKEATETGLIISGLLFWASGPLIINYMWHRRTGKTFTTLQFLLLTAVYIAIGIFIFFVALIAASEFSLRY